MRSDYKNIQEYIAKLPQEQQLELNRIYDLIKKAVPDADEGISYGMPAFKYKNKPLIYFGGFKDHMSIFPTSGPIVELSEELTPFLTSKGTVQFTVENNISDDLVSRIVQKRLDQINNA